MDPAGLVWIVTGGKSGLGAAVVQALDARKAYVAVLDLNASPDDNQPGANVAHFPCDAGDEPSVKHALEGVKAHWKGKKWGGLCHAAGVGMAGKVRSPPLAPPSPPLSCVLHWASLTLTHARRLSATTASPSRALSSSPLSPSFLCRTPRSASFVLTLRLSPRSFDVFQEVHRINLLGSFLMASNVAAVLAAQGGTIARDADPSTVKDRGVIVLTSSVSATEGQMGQVAYGSSKAAVEGLVLPMARDLARYGAFLLSSSTCA